MLDGPEEIAVVGPPGAERDALALAARRRRGAVVVVADGPRDDIPLLVGRDAGRRPAGGVRLPRTSSASARSPTPRCCDAGYAAILGRPGASESLARRRQPCSRRTVPGRCDSGACSVTRQRASRFFDGGRPASRPTATGRCGSCSSATSTDGARRSRWSGRSATTTGGSAAAGAGRRRFRTDLTSVPWLFTWLVPAHRSAPAGRAAPRRPGRRPPTTRRPTSQRRATSSTATRPTGSSATRWATLGTGPVRRWLVWAAVRRRVDRRGRLRGVVAGASASLPARARPPPVAGGRSYLGTLRDASTCSTGAGASTGGSGRRPAVDAGAAPWLVRARRAVVAGAVVIPLALSVGCGSCYWRRRQPIARRGARRRWLHVTVAVARGGPSSTALAEWSPAASAGRRLAWLIAVVGRSASRGRSSSLRRSAQRVRRERDADVVADERQDRQRVEHLVEAEPARRRVGELRAVDERRPACRGRRRRRPARARRCRSPAP